MLDITEIRIRKILPEGKMKAVISVTLGNAFVIHDIKIIKGHSGLFVAMPSRPTPSGGYRDIAHPISQEFRDELQLKILETYEEALRNNISPTDDYE